MSPTKPSTPHTLCPYSVCTWMTQKNRYNDNVWHIGVDCQNRGPEFCPISGMPWRKNGQVPTKYPPGTKNREHCEKVWNKYIETHPMDVYEEYDPRTDKKADKLSKDVSRGTYMKEETKDGSRLDVQNTASPRRKSYTEELMDDGVDPDLAKMWAAMTFEAQREDELNGEDEGVESKERKRPVRSKARGAHPFALPRRILGGSGTGANRNKETAHGQGAKEDGYGENRE